MPRQGITLICVNMATRNVCHAPIFFPMNSYDIATREAPSRLPLSSHPIAAYSRNEATVNLSGGHGLGDKTLESKLLLLKVLSRAVGDLEGSHGIRDGGLDLLLLATLELERQRGVRDNLLNTADVRLELLLGLKLLAESLVVGLELLGIADHLLDLAGGELTDRVGDGDVGAAARGLLSGGNLEDTVDVDLEDTLENGLTSPHGRDGSKSELAQRGVVLAVDTLTLEDGELDGLLVVGNSGEGSMNKLVKCC